MDVVTASRLQELLDYNPHTGIFTRLKGVKGYSVGSKVGSVNSDGYLRIMIDGRKYQSHRLAFLWMTGDWPKDEVDHIDGERMNNRWDNLREATQSQNQANSKIKSTNTSGLKGASFHKQRQKWLAQIQINSRQRFLGYFDTKEEAHESYCSAAIKLQGEFARFA